MRADVIGATMGGQPTADGAHSSDGDVESGTIGHPHGAFLAGRFSWSKTTLTHGSACPRSDTPHPTPACPSPPSQHSRHQHHHPRRENLSEGESVSYSAVNRFDCTYTHEGV